MGRLGFAGNATKAVGCGHPSDWTHPSVQGLQTWGWCRYKPWFCHWCLQQYHLWCKPKLCPHGHWWLAGCGLCIRTHWWWSEGWQNWFQEDSHYKLCSLTLLVIWYYRFYFFGSFIDLIEPLFCYFCIKFQRFSWIVWSGAQEYVWDE